MSRSKKSRDKDSFIRKPEYPGGRAALQQFLKKHLRYPEAAMEQRVEGKVYLSFWVDHHGDVKDVQVLKGLGFGCDEEAVRLAGMLKYSPQKNRGSRVAVHHRMNISFKLPAARKKGKPEKGTAAEGRTFQYTYKPAGSDQSPPTTYSYTIRFRKP